MKNFFKKYLFVFEFIGVAILLAVGIFLFVEQHLFLYIAGIALIIFGLYRAIPLVKTTKDKAMRWIYVGEIILNVGAGILLISEGTKGEGNYNENLLRWVLGGVLYLRGFLYFFSTVMRKESTDYPKFFTHIAIFTLATGLLFRKDLLNEAVIAWIVLVLSILSSIFISISGIGHYRNFRYEQLAKDETRKAMEKNKEEVKEKEIPLEDPKPIREPIIDSEEEKEEIRL